MSCNDQLLLEQCIGALQFSMSQEQALNSIGEFLDLRHGGFWELVAIQGRSLRKDDSRMVRRWRPKMPADCKWRLCLEWVSFGGASELNRHGWGGCRRKSRLGIEHHKLGFAEAATIKPGG